MRGLSMTPASAQGSGTTGERAPAEAGGLPPGGSRARLCTSPEPTELDAWDEFVRRRPGADVTQLSAWARLRALAGYRPVYLWVERDGELQGGALVLTRRIPVLGTVGYVSYGPLLDPSVDEGNGISAVLADALTDLGRKLRMLIVQPVEDGEAMREALLGRGFRPSDAEIAPSVTLRVDLSLDEEQLRRNLGKRLRTWTNTWSKHGVTVRRAGEQDLPVVAGLLEETGRHHRFAPFGLDYLEVMHRGLDPAGHLVTFLGEVAGRPIAMGMFTGCGGVLKTRFVGLDRSGTERRLNVAAAVYWTAISWAKTAGYHWFDFGGILPESVPVLLDGGSTEHGPLPGPDQFKLRFGGQPFVYPAPVELVASPPFRWGYDLVRRSRGGQAVVAYAQRLARSGRRPRAQLPGGTTERGRRAIPRVLSLFRAVIKPLYVRTRLAVRLALFDHRYGVDTESEVSLAELGVTDPRSARYQPAGVFRLRRILPPREVGPDDVFLDFGSGKGRALLQAAMHYPFRRVYGVEISERLSDIAQRNLGVCRDRLRCPDVRLIRADASRVEMPDDVTVVLFNNPFVGELFETVVQRLLESLDRHPRRLRIVYGNPVEEAALIRTGRVRPVRTLRGWRPGKQWARSNSFRLYEVT